jgi:hypothetical protein
MSRKDVFRSRSGWEVPPWEIPGNFRLDCEPHRGFLLRWLANIAFLCALGAWGFFLTTPLFYLGRKLGYATSSFVVLGCAAGILGLAAWLLARRDLARIRAGCMDPTGEGEVQFARTRGCVSFLLSLSLGLPCGLLILPLW